MSVGFGVRASCYIRLPSHPDIRCTYCLMCFNVIQHTAALQALLQDSPTRSGNTSV